MARKFLVPIDLAKGELQNAAIQSLAAAPSSPVKFQLYGNTTDNTLYWWDGAQWIAAKAAAGATPAATVTTQAVGDSPVVGVSTNFAREDHKHGREAFGAITAETAFGSASGNGSAATLARSDHTHGNPVHDNNAHSAINLSALAVPTTAVSFNSQRITSLGTPSAGTDAVTKDYADNLSAGLSWKEAVRIATTANVTQSGLTAIDGVTPVANDRILCKDQSTGSQNGIWLAQSGAWSRALDADAVGELEGATVFVMEGTANADKAFTCTTNATITPGSTATTWVQFGAGTSYSGGAGLVLTGSTFDVGAGLGITVAADAVALDTSYTDGRYVLLASGIKRFTANVGGATSQVLTHNFGTRDVQVQVYRVASPYDTVECDVERTDTNNITLRFATAPAASEYRAVIFG